MDKNESTSTGNLLVGWGLFLLIVILVPFLAQWFLNGVFAGDVKKIKPETFEGNVCVVSRDGGIFASKGFGTQFYLEYTLNTNQFNVNCYEELVEDMEKKTNTYSFLRRSPDFALIYAGSETYQFEIPISEELVNEANVAMLFKEYKEETKE